MENVLFVAEGIVFLGFIASPLAKKVISTPLNANVEISITDAVAKNRPFGPEIPFLLPSPASARSNVGRYSP